MTKKPLVWLIAGTSEGRNLIQYLKNEEVSIIASVATEYGANLIKQQNNLEVIAKRMTKDEMEDLIITRKPDLVIDATHPYALEITKLVEETCKKTSTRYLRLIRESENLDNCVLVASYEEAVDYLESTTGNIFLTTGSKTLELYTKISDYKERIFLRILPMVDSLNKAISLGYKSKNIICMQGPFSKDMDLAMFKQAQVKFVVTKDTGVAGGFREKKAACEEIGATLVVIQRLIEEKGDSFPEILEEIKKLVVKGGGNNA